MSESKARLRTILIKNVKSIREVEITPDGDITEIRGDAGQGKTSVLQAIEAAIRGMDPSMVRKGESAGEITIDAGIARINRIIKADGSKDYLAVTGENGQPVEKVKDFLAAIFGKDSFDPLAWVQLGSGENKGKTERLRRQRDELLDSMPVRLDTDEVVDRVTALGSDVKASLMEVDLGSVDFVNQHALVACREVEEAVYNHRKSYNDTLKRAESTLAITLPASSIPPDVDIEELRKIEEQASKDYHTAMGRIEARASTRERADRLEAKIEQAAKQLPSREGNDRSLTLAKERETKLNGEIADMQARLDRMRQEHRQARAFIEELERTDNQLDNLDDDRQELAQIRAEIDGGEVNDPEALRKAWDAARINCIEREAQDCYDAAVNAVTEARNKSECYDKLVTLFRDELPKSIIERMEMPVEGLGVDGDNVTLHGIPLHQLGTSQQISVGVKLYAARHPRIGFCPVDRAESIGREDRKALAEAAHDLGMQLIMTIVDPDAIPGPGVVVMRGGEAVRGEEAGEVVA
ncbi:MAG: AAA family ATPase [Bryobacteraceae bacterium]